MKEMNPEKYDFGKNCICIGRRSTFEQSQTAQLADLKNYARSLGYKKIHPVFTTESGFLEFDAKQGWNLVTDFLEKNKDYRVIICPEISRLSRRQGILQKIKDYLIDNRIQLIIKDLEFRLFDDKGEVSQLSDMVFALHASLASSEMRQKKERFRRALTDLRQQGYSIGGKELFGYTRVYEEKNGKKRSKYLINPEEAKEIKTIYKWYADGIDGDLTQTSIVKITKRCIEEGFSNYLHSRRNVNKCLKEHAYTGQKETHNRVYNAEFWSYKNTDKPKYIEGVSYTCSYPAIFEGGERLLFDRVQERMRANSTRLSKKEKLQISVDKSTAHTTVLSKLVRCPNCGSFLCGEYRQRIDTRGKIPHTVYSFTYRCNNSRGVVHNCGFKNTFSMPTLDSIVWAYCEKAALLITNNAARKQVSTLVAEIDRKINNLNDQIKSFNVEGKRQAEDAILRSRMARQMSKKEREETLIAYNKNIKRIDKELSEYEKRIVELKHERDSIVQEESWRNSLNERDSMLKSKQTVYKLIHQIVSKVEIVYANKKYYILQVITKNHVPFYRFNQYICVRRNTTGSEALIIRCCDTDSSNRKTVVQRSDRSMLTMGACSHELQWQDETEQFVIDHVTPFTLKDVFDNYKYQRFGPSPMIEGLDLLGLPIQIIPLDYQRLAFYDEDKK